MKALFSLLLLIALALGGMVLLSHQDVKAKADLAYKKFAPVSASFSRFRVDKAHLLSIYWRLGFPGKKAPAREAIAVWSLQPFRHVAIETKK